MPMYAQPYDDPRYQRLATAQYRLYQSTVGAGRYAREVKLNAVQRVAVREAFMKVTQALEIIEGAYLD